MKKVLLWSFAVVSAITALTYLTSCLTPFISPVAFWPMAFLALGFPYLALAMAGLAIIWLVVNWRISLLLFLLLSVGFQNIRATLALNRHPTDEPVPKPDNCLRILTWNVRSFDNPSKYTFVPGSVRWQMFNFIDSVKPDVLCLQEYSEHIGPSMLSNTDQLVGMGYKYYYRTNDIVRQYNFGTMISGTAIFSKIPFADTGRVLLGDSSYPEHLAFVDLVLQNRKLRIFSTHFKSINLFATPVDTTSKISFHGDETFVYTQSKFNKLKCFAQDHVRQATIIRQQMRQSTYPFVFVTDMNSVPTSYPYHMLASGLQDAFLQKGNGLGTTLDNLPKTLRIDFMLVHKRLQIQHYRRNQLHLSDHFPQYIDVKW